MIYSKIIVSIPTVPKEIYRFIRVGDSLPLKELCEKIILCMNGSLKYGYCLTVNDRKYVSENFEEKEYRDFVMDAFKFRDLHVKKDQVLILSYMFKDYWDFKITIKSPDCQGPLYSDENFEILNGYGKGIIEKLDGMYELEAFVKGLYSQKEKKKLKLDEIDIYDYDIGDYGIS